MYTPEVGITLKDLQKDVDFLKLRYSLDEKGKAEGRLILRYALLYCKGKLLSVTLFLGMKQLRLYIPLTSFKRCCKRKEAPSSTHAWRLLVIPCKEVFPLQ